MTELTPDDIVWLESRIGSAIQPVSPREDFVRSARLRVIAAAHEPPDPFELEISVSKALMATTFVFVAALVWRNYISQRSRK